MRLAFAVGLVLLLFAVPAVAQEAYTFGLKWERSEDPGVDFYYEIGFGLTAGAYTEFHSVESTWDTVNVIAQTAGPWFIGVHVCLVRGEAEPLCGDDWTIASQEQGGNDFGPFFPATLTVPTVPTLWLTGAPAGPGF